MQNFLCQMCVMKKRMKRQVPFILQTCHDILEQIGFWKLQFYGDMNARLSWYSDRHICKTNTFIWIFERKTFNLLYSLAPYCLQKKGSRIWELLASFLIPLDRQTNLLYMQNSSNAQYALYMAGEITLTFGLVSSCLCVQMRIL